MNGVSAINKTFYQNEYILFFALCDCLAATTFFSNRFDSWRIGTAHTHTQPLNIGHLCLAYRETLSADTGHGRRASTITKKFVLHFYYCIATVDTCVRARATNNTEISWLPKMCRMCWTAHRQTMQTDWFLVGIGNLNLCHFDVTLIDVRDQNVSSKWGKDVYLHIEWMWCDDVYIA